MSDPAIISTDVGASTPLRRARRKVRASAGGKSAGVNEPWVRLPWSDVRTLVVNETWVRLPGVMYGPSLGINEPWVHLPRRGAWTLPRTEPFV